MEASNIFSGRCVACDAPAYWVPGKVDQAVYGKVDPVTGFPRCFFCNGEVVRDVVLPALDEKAE